ncbi:hypothetical protein [Alteribacter populi]|uniref:hypothetical protein n=1 Tax=Alteribacter populi TaxID=2011011 RepID=UPI000BBAEF45|nr:hypothetical protein [Alteribacter populi]
MRKKGLYGVMLVTLLGCSSTSAEDEVISMIDGGNYNVSYLINEYNLTDLEETSYDYNQFLLYEELEGLFNDDEYIALIKKVQESSISEEVLIEPTVTLLENSFSGLLDDGDSVIAKNRYNDLNDEYKSFLSHIEDEINLVEQERKEASEREREEKEEEARSKIGDYIEMIHNQDYETLIFETLSGTTEVEENYYNLANAYDEFFNDSSGLDETYIHGLQSMAEFYLGEISNPDPETEELIESLYTMIEMRKNEDAGELGVIVGMTVEQVLSSQWGEPNKVNTRTTNYGVREQWVYGNGHYLYFEDGILVSITTRDY